MIKAIIVSLYMITVIVGLQVKESSSNKNRTNLRLSLMKALRAAGCTNKIVS